MTIKSDLKMTSEILLQRKEIVLEGCVDMRAYDSMSKTPCFKEIKSCHQGKGEKTGSEDDRNWCSVLN